MTEKEIRVNELVDYYINQTNHQSVPIQIHFVDNINDAWIFYTSNDIVIRQYLEQDFTNYNGLTMPYDGETYHLLIRNDYQDYECTVIHECTHAFDYEWFRLSFNNGDLHIENHKNYWSMALYSEFHARSIAHRYFISQNIIENQADFIKQEFLAIIESIIALKTSLANNEISYQNFSYELMQYIGRLDSYGIDYNNIEGFPKKLLSLYNVLYDLNTNRSSENFDLLMRLIKVFSLADL